MSSEEEDFAEFQRLIDEPLGRLILRKVMTTAKGDQVTRKVYKQKGGGYREDILVETVLVTDDVVAGSQRNWDHGERR